jgi:hypothetical protein
MAARWGAETPVLDLPRAAGLLPLRQPARGYGGDRDATAWPPRSPVNRHPSVAADSPLDRSRVTSARARHLPQSRTHRLRRWLLLGAAFFWTMAKSPPDLAACRARLSDPSWPRADLSPRPVCISRGARRLVQIAFRGVQRFSLSAQFLQASAYGRKVVGGARSCHVSSHPLGRVLVAPYGPRAGAIRS